MVEIQKYNITNDTVGMDAISNVAEEFNCSICTNELCFEDVHYQLYEDWISVNNFETVLIILHTIQILTGILGNLLVLIAVTTTKSMQSVTNIFIVNLAVADMLVMLFCAPPSVIWDVTNTWIFGSVLCKVVIYIQDVSVSVSVLTLTFIAYDRYHAICKPLQFNAQKTKVARVIGGIWTVAGIIGIPDFSLESKSPFDKGGTAYNPCISDDILFDLSACSSNWNTDVDFAFMVTKALVLYTLPLLLMLVAYYYICHTLWKTDSHLPGSQNTAAPESTSPSSKMVSTKASRSAQKTNKGNFLSVNKSSDSQITKCNGASESSTVNRSEGIHSSLSSIASMDQKKPTSTKWQTIMRRILRKKSPNDPDSSKYIPNSPSPQNPGSVSTNQVNKGLDNQLKTRRKVAKMLIAVVIMFAINFFPVHFIPIFQYTVEKTLTAESQLREQIHNFLMYAGIITHFLCYFNSAVNPIIYYFMSAQFKTQYRRILTCARCGQSAREIKTKTTRATKIVHAAKSEHRQNPDRSDGMRKQCLIGNFNTKGNTMSNISNISSRMQFTGSSPSINGNKMELVSADDNGVTNTRCKSTTLKVNPNQMVIGGYVETCEKSIKQSHEKQDYSSKNGDQNDSEMQLENISHTTKLAQPSLSTDPRTKKWSFDEGPCPCTNGSMKGKALTKSSKNDSTTAADVYPPQLDCEKSNKDDDDGCDGEGDRLLIAHLSPECSKVTHIDDGNTRFDASHVHNCLESPDLDNLLSDDSSLFPFRQKVSGPTLHNVKAKRISLLTTNTKFKPNEDKKSEDEINERKRKSGNENLKENGTVS